MGNRHTVIKQSKSRCIVCSVGTIEEAKEWVRANHPSDTSGNWVIDADPACAPVLYSALVDHEHYIFTAACI